LKIEGGGSSFFPSSEDGDGVCDGGGPPPVDFFPWLDELVFDANEQESTEESLERHGSRRCGMIKDRWN